MDDETERVGKGSQMRYEIGDRVCVWDEYFGLITEVDERGRFAVDFEGENPVSNQEGFNFYEDEISKAPFLNDSEYLERHGKKDA